MSYSFSAIGADKEAAKAAVVEEFDKQVLACQPIHVRDRAAVIAHAHAMIDLLPDDPSKAVHIACNGYVSSPIHGDPAEVPLSVASATASASLIERS
jgi:diadenosine tetraphosphatase ApaH/serine/threonine PP2A family protein phosphatase